MTKVYEQRKAMVRSGPLKGHSGQRVRSGLEGVKTGEKRLGVKPVP